MKLLPLVTIGITSYNSEKTIKKAIEGALKQTWLNKEIIVVDDFSNDNSIKVIESSTYRKAIRLYKNIKNLGASESRNKIIKESKGEIICFMDDDDWSMPNRVKKQMQAIFNSGYPNKRLIACTASMERVYANKFKRELIAMGSRGLVPEGAELANFILYYEKKNNVDYGFGLPTCSLTITKDCFKKCGIFDKNLIRVEDLDMAIRLSFNNVIFTGVKEILIKQTVSLRENKNPENNLNSEIKVIEKNKDYLINKKLFWHSKQWPLIRYYYFKNNYLRLIFNLLLVLLANPKRSINHFLQTGGKRLILDLRTYLR